MAEESPTKSDIGAIFKRLRQIPANRLCFDCNSKLPTWSSVTYGVFICIDCSAVHRSLGVHLSFVRSTQLDTNWTWLQLRAMQVGGNSNANSFFTQHNCTTNDAQQKYNSRAAHLYREKLHQLAVNAMKVHGTKLNLDTPNSASAGSPEVKEVDFFKEHTDTVHESQTINITETNLAKASIKADEMLDSAGPSVEAALSTSPSEAVKQTEIRKPLIGNRRPAPTKKGLGSKKGGLGAQKVSTNFNDIEREAQLADQQKEQATIEEKLSQERRMEEETKKLASMNLAYKDLSAQQKKAEASIMQSNPQKAAQFERLGMGFGGRSLEVHHSAALDMKTIEQEAPKKSSDYSLKDPEFFEDEFEMLGFTSGPPKYNDSPFSKTDRYSNNSSKNEDKYSSKGNFWDYDKKNTDSSFRDSTESSRTKKSPTSLPPATNNDAYKKFGNAKSISSEQYFSGSNDGDYERRTNLSRFEGSSSISSADYFGDSSNSSRNRASANYSAPDLDDIKEGVKAGVTKVAGKISSLANGVMTSLQDRYGY